MPRSNTPAFTVATDHFNKSNTSYFENHYTISCVVNIERATLIHIACYPLS